MNAKLTVTKLTCNYQDGLAVTAGDIRVGWQMKADTNGDRQTAYRIRIFENITGKKCLRLGQRRRRPKAKLISLPPLKRQPPRLLLAGVRMGRRRQKVGMEPRSNM